MEIILEAIVGSTVHGLAVQDGLEDLDLMAIAIEDLSQFIGFHPREVWVRRTKPEGVRSEAGDVDHVTYGLRKDLGLALKGNPSVLLPLFAPLSHVRILTETGCALRALMPDIISQRVYAPFRGYMQQQHDRLMGRRGGMRVTRPELIQAYGFDTKYASHVLRLGFQGEELLRTGQLTLPMPDAERMLIRQVRMGGVTLDAVSDLIQEAQQRLEDAYATSPLRPSPNAAKVEAWMIATYFAAWQGTPDA